MNGLGKVVFYFLRPNVNISKKLNFFLKKGRIISIIFKFKVQYPQNRKSDFGVFSQTTDNFIPYSNERIYIKKIGKKISQI